MEEKNIIQMYHEYVKAFETLKVQAILPFYSTPFMSITAKEVTVLQTPAELEENLKAIMENLKHYNYARTEIIELKVKPMADGLALVHAILERYTADGKQLGGTGKQFAYTYTVRKTDHQWQFVSVIYHDPGSIIFNS